MSDKGGSAGWSQLRYFVVGTLGSLRNPDLLHDLRQLRIRRGAVSAQDLRGATPSTLEALVDATGAQISVGRAMTGGETGCALSHRDLWDVAWQTGCEWALVLEDDAIVRPTLSEALQLTMTLPREVPIIVALYDSLVGGRTTPVLRRPVRTGPNLSLYACVHNTNGSLGYVVNRSALALLRSQTGELVCPADWPPVAGQIEFIVAWPHPLRTMDGEEYSRIGARNAQGSVELNRVTRVWRNYFGGYWVLKRRFPDYYSYFRWAYGSGRGFMKHAATVGLVRTRVRSEQARTDRQFVVRGPLAFITRRRKRLRVLYERWSRAHDN